MICPCGSNKEYLMCCGQYIEQHQLPATPEQLMRSRYTAYTKANIDYIRKTMQGRAALRFDHDSAKNRTEQVQWLKLEVLQSYIDSYNKNRGFVEFKAYYRLATQEHCLHELSEFHLQDGQWSYVDGKHEFKSSNKIKASRNDPCICGSGKKYKKCCGMDS